jgi:hypothetical protein
MAIAHVQTTGADSQSSPISRAYGAAVTAGNTLFLDLGYTENGVRVSSVVDTLGNPWVLRKRVIGSARSVESWQVASTLGGVCTVTVTFGAAKTGIGIAVAEYSGLGAGLTLDQQNNQEHTTAGTSHACGPITTTQIGLIRALIRLSSSYTVSTPPAGYTVRRSSGATNMVIVYDKIATATETTDPTLVTTTSLADHGMVYNVVAAAAAAARVDLFTWLPS